MIKLRNRNIIVKLREQKELSCGLIKVNKSKHWQEEQYEAEVVNVGPNVDEVAVGDLVIISGEAGKWLDPGVVDPTDLETTYRLVTESDILCAITQIEQPEAVYPIGMDATAKVPA
jgi:co-chaperonin GroES (HSP10)